MKILITGAAGYLGSVLVEKLLAANHQVVAYDNLMYRQTSLMPFCHHKNFTFINADVRDTETLHREIPSADAIIPLAAIVGAPACDANPELATQVNHHQLAFIVNHATSAGSGHFRKQVVIMPNTNSGYGVGQKDTFCTEETPINPISHYGRTKCDGEKAVLAKGGVSLRLATVFGLSYRMRLDLLVNDFTYRAVNDGFLALFEKHFKRNYIHVRDVAKAFMFILDYVRKDDSIRGQAFNVGLSSANLSKLELAEKVKSYLPKTAILSDDFKKDPDKRDYIVSNAKLEGLGWTPDHTIDDGIKELIAGYPMIFHSQQIHTNL